MIIIRGLHNLPDINSQLFLTIGNFDGLHLGHKKIIQFMKQKARQKNARTMILSFFPHPMRVLNPSAKQGLLLPLREKIRSLAELEIDFFLIIRFTAQFARLKAEKFIEDILYKNLQVKEIFLGRYHTFGYNNRGNVGLLTALGEKYHFTVHKIDEVIVDEQRVSSSLIRKFLKDGKILEANRYLGRSYSITGKVVHGSSRGNELGFPTANLAVNGQLIPAAGVYFARIFLNERIFEGLVNIGCRPTFKEKEIIMEIHILDFSGSIYGRTMRVEFLKRLRDEIAFSTSTHLTQQIKRDIDKVRQWMRERE